MGDSKGSQGTTDGEQIAEGIVFCLYIITRDLSCLSTLVSEYFGWKNTSLLDRQLQTMSLAVFYNK